ncbi:HlyD family efflux transporter periplasmic adaptor subunit [uncultured Alistipes sp.]|uniref:HlyD family efflux transporter periplasmic adaptor subunit n=1 Tax=uncultured Alistipes sp. TaxID=538949 RepID=UPI00259BC5CB|nr:HlyD family efflux transporter periplasmic adaptor subunit [uncultured Alistipes sp.]
MRVKLEKQVLNKNGQDSNAKNEEVQNIIDKMPTHWAKVIALITFLLISLVTAFGFIIRYPDTVDGIISITANSGPIRIVANSSGRIHLIKKNGDFLKKGDVIAYMEGGANYYDILMLDSLLKTCNHDIPQIDSFSNNWLLGDISNVYNIYVNTLYNYLQLKESDIYETIRINLKEKIALDKQIIKKIEEEIELKSKMIDSTKSLLNKDSILLTRKALTAHEYQQSQNTFLLYQEALLNLQSSKLEKQSSITQNKLEIQRITLEENENIQKSYTELVASRNDLINALNQWKEKYVQYAPIDGELEYLGFWRNNIYVNSGDELFTIIPEETVMIGEVHIPSTGAGKVEIGQLANVKLQNYPYDEYGYLRGKVNSISRLTNKLKTKEGKANTYLVSIIFPEGTITNFGKELSIDFETEGQVEIITKDKRLIERLFDNLKAHTTK